MIYQCCWICCLFNHDDVYHDDMEVKYMVDKTWLYDSFVYAEVQR